MRYLHRQHAVLQELDSAHRKHTAFRLSLLVYMAHLCAKVMTAFELGICAASWSSSPGSASVVALCGVPCPSRSGETDCILGRTRRLSSLPASLGCCAGHEAADAAACGVVEAREGMGERVRSSDTRSVKDGAGRYSAGLRAGDDPDDGSGLATGHGLSASASATARRSSSCAMCACRQGPRGLHHSSGPLQTSKPPCTLATAYVQCT